MMIANTISTNRKWLILSGAYVLIVLLIGGYLNYVTPYSGEPEVNPEPWMIIIWALLYLPVIILPLVAKRNVSDFGFTVTPRLAIGFVLIFLLCAPLLHRKGISWGGAAIEAFARTGEEIFFRGFVFDLFYRLCSNRRRPWLWAVIGSSILFTVVHTQTFQESYLIGLGYPSRSVFYIIFERFINLFGGAIVFALIRVTTKSILLPAIFHSVLQSSILALPFVLLIYFAAIFWAYKRGEKIVFGFPDNSD